MCVHGQDGQFRCGSSHSQSTVGSVFAAHEDPTTDRFDHREEGVPKLCRPGWAPSVSRIVRHPAWIATVAMILPSSLLAFIAGRFVSRWQSTRWIKIAKAG